MLGPDLFGARAPVTVVGLLWGCALLLIGAALVLTVCVIAFASMLRRRS